MNCPAPKLSRPGTGFTLLELLVTVSVVLVLAALLFPAMKGGLAKSRSAACVSNLRQIATAVQLFAGENENRLPDLDPAGLNGWRYQFRQIQLLAPYLNDGAKVDSVFTCPEATANDAGRVWPAYYGTSLDGRTVFTDYKLNDNWEILAAPLSKLPHTSTLVVAADIDWQVNSQKNWRHPGGKSGGLHFAFFDGSVRRISSAEFLGADQYGATAWYMWGTK